MTNTTAMARLCFLLAIILSATAAEIRVGEQFSLVNEMEIVDEFFVAKEDLLEPVPDEFIAVLDSNLVSTTREQQSLLQRLETEYQVMSIRQMSLTTMKALLLSGSEFDVMQAAEKVREIKYVEPNQFIYAAATGDFCTEQSVDGYGWGLNRIDQREVLADPSTGVYSHSSGDSGEGVDVYVMDTGIYLGHPEFEGRAVWGYTAYNITDGDMDLNGHGTHVAGTIGARTWGVAKRSALTAVKVLNGDGYGSTAGLVDAMAWIASDHNSKSSSSGQKRKAVMNLSLGMNGTSAAMEDALQDLIDLGITAVVAAGNDYSDACGFSPALVQDAITVAASNSSDFAAYFTNWGTCVDLFAPGHDIVSTFPGDNLAQASGTSMAAPHVAGVVARYLSRLDVAPTPLEVKNYILSEATSDALALYDDELTTPNKLLYAECYSGSAQRYVNVWLLLATWVIVWSC